MYSDVFCKVYNEFGWNYYPEAFGGQLLLWTRSAGWKVGNLIRRLCSARVMWKRMAV